MAFFFFLPHFPAPPTSKLPCCSLSLYFQPDLRTIYSTWSLFYLSVPLNVFYFSFPDSIKVTMITEFIKLCFNFIQKIIEYWILGSTSEKYSWACVLYAEIVNTINIVKGQKSIAKIECYRQDYFFIFGEPHLTASRGSTLSFVFTIMSTGVQGTMVPGILVKHTLNPLNYLTAP